MKRNKVDMDKAHNVFMSSNFELKRLAFVERVAKELSGQLSTIDPDKRGDYMNALVDQYISFRRSVIHQAPFSVFSVPQNLVSEGLTVRAMTTSWKVYGATPWPNPPGFVMHKILDDVGLKAELDALLLEVQAVKAYANDTVKGNH